MGRPLRGAGPGVVGKAMIVFCPQMVLTCCVIFSLLVVCSVSCRPTAPLSGGFRCQSWASSGLVHSLLAPRTGASNRQDSIASSAARCFQQQATCSFLLTPGPMQSDANQACDRCKDASYSLGTTMPSMICVAFRNLGFPHAWQWWTLAAFEWVMAG